MKIGIIGLGNMGNAIYRQLKNVVGPRQIFLCSRERPKGVDKKIYFSTDANDVCRAADIVIIAVKPQSFAGLLDSVEVDLSKKIIVSIMAGVTLKKLEQLTGSKKVVRSMPNLSAQIGLGVTEWVASKSVIESEKNIIKKILGSLGHEIELKNENLIAKLGMISGCGPAYFFYLTELLENQAIKYGLSVEESKKVTSLTLYGAASLLCRGNKSAADWRTAVTSKGGVTEAVLKYLKNKKFDRIFYQALNAGIKRSEELNK